MWEILGPQYHHLINLAHPTFLQVHLGPQEPLMLADFSRHAKVHVHTIRGPGGGGHCKAWNRGISLKPVSRLPSLPGELHFLEHGGDHQVSTYPETLQGILRDIVLNRACSREA